MTETKPVAMPKQTVTPHIVVRARGQGEQPGQRLDPRRARATGIAAAQTAPRAAAGRRLYRTRAIAIVAASHGLTDAPLRHDRRLRVKAAAKLRQIKAAGLAGAS